MRLETLQIFDQGDVYRQKDRKEERQKDRKKGTKTQFNIVIPGRFDTLAMFYLISVIRGVWEVQEV